MDAFNRWPPICSVSACELERTNRLAAWADMARQVAHDIKNPLTPIQLSAEHLRHVHQDPGAPLGGVFDSCVDTILSQVALLRQISSEFSSFASSPRRGRRRASINEVVDDVWQPYRAAPPVRVAIEAVLAPDFRISSIDRTLCARALVNIIENALHAMPAGGTLRVRTSRAGERVVIEVDRHRRRHGQRGARAVVRAVFFDARDRNGARADDREAERRTESRHDRRHEPAGTRDDGAPRVPGARARATDYFGVTPSLGCVFDHSSYCFSSSALSFG